MTNGASSRPGAGGPRARGERRISNTVVALGFVSLLTDTASEMVYTQVPLFLTQVLGQGPAVVGLIEGVAESTASLFKVISGGLSDAGGRRKPLTVAGYSLSAITKPLMALAAAWPAVLLLRFLDRTGKGLRTAPRDALIAEVTAKENRGRAYGLHRAMDTVGAILGPLLGVWFLSFFIGSADRQLRALFLFAGIPGALAVLTLMFFVREKPAPPRPVPAADAGSGVGRGFSALAHWRELDPAYRRFLGIMFLFNLGNSSDAFLILRAHHFGFGQQTLLWLYAAFNVVEAVLGYSAGVLSDTVGRRPLIIAGFGIFALVYLGFALVNSATAAAIWPLFLLYGGYYTLTQGSQRAFAADFADPARRGLQIGAYHTVVGIALLPASIIGGVLYRWRPGAPFFLGAATAAICALLLASQRSPSKPAPAA
ncbi:MAG TPA: MFS transporter [Chthonomonadaceae bacterium]|nr:MFS transporter [Chthonomonadaceae bacterium]